MEQLKTVDRQQWHRNHLNGAVGYAVYGEILKQDGERN